MRIILLVIKNFQCLNIMAPFFLDFIPLFLILAPFSTFLINKPYILGHVFKLVYPDFIIIKKPVSEKPADVAR
jgi:hypothetical protein